MSAVSFSLHVVLMQPLAASPGELPASHVQWGLRGSPSWGSPQQFPPPRAHIRLAALPSLGQGFVISSSFAPDYS